MTWVEWMVVILCILFLVLYALEKYKRWRREKINKYLHSGCAIFKKKVEILGVLYTAIKYIADKKVI